MGTGPDGQRGLSAGPMWDGLKSGGIRGRCLGRFGVGAGGRAGAIGNRSGGDSTSTRGRFGIHPGSLRGGRFGVGSGFGSGPIRGPDRVDCGSFRDRFLAVSGSFRGQSGFDDGADLGSIRDRRGDDLVSLRAAPGWSWGRCRAEPQSIPSSFGVDLRSFMPGRSEVGRAAEKGLHPPSPMPTQSSLKPTSALRGKALAPHAGVRPIGVLGDVGGERGEGASCERCPTCGEGGR